MSSHFSTSTSFGSNRVRWKQKGIVDRSFIYVFAWKDLLLRQLGVPCDSKEKPSCGRWFAETTDRAFVFLSYTQSATKGICLHDKPNQATNHCYVKRVDRLKRVISIPETKAVHLILWFTQPRRQKGGDKMARSVFVCKLGTAHLN